MIQYLIFFILLLITFLWTISIAPVFNLGFINLGLVIGLVYLLRQDKKYVLWGFVIGLLFDIASLYFFGIFTFSLLLALVVAEIIISVYRHNDIMRVFLISASSIVVYNASVLLLIFISSKFVNIIFSLDISFEFWKMRIIELIFVSAVLLFNYFLMKKVSSLKI